MKDPLLGNKISAAVLAALLLVFGLPQLPRFFHSPGHYVEKDGLHLSYCCVDLDFGEETATSGEEKPYDLGLLLASADPVAGARRAAGMCGSCHSFTQGGANGAGPNLWNRVGADIASVDGFKYTPALGSLEGVWTWDRLDRFLANSQEYVPGGGMVQRVGNDARRAEILAYLGSLSPDAPAFPDPLPQDIPEDGGEEAGTVPDAAGDGVPDDAGPASFG